jgi:dTDP-4-amino-4,6-dideoxygalactose transaminase
MTMFSFHPVKAVTCGEGGIVTTRDAGLRDALRDFRGHGMTRALEHPDGGWSMEQYVLGFNYRLTDIQSALGRSQLGKLERFIAARNAVADRYRAALGDVAALGLPPAAPPGALHAYHLFVVHCRDGAPARRALYDGLRERGILAQVHYLPPYRHPWYRETYGYQAGLCPAAEDYYAGCLSLPCYPALSEDDQRAVVAAVRELVA